MNAAVQHSSYRTYYSRKQNTNNTGKGIKEWQKPSCCWTRTSLDSTDSPYFENKQGFSKSLSTL